MIRGNFRIGGEIIEVIIKGNELMFVDSHGTMTTIEGIKLDRGGCIREHPDLKDNPDWKQITKERFKKHYKTFSTERQKLEYVKTELNKFGYEPMFYQRAGHRPTKFK